MTRKILGRYEITRKIAESNDVIWEGHDPEIGRRVAIKQLRIPKNASAEGQREARIRFGRQAVAAAALNHPNIVSIYDAGTENGESYIIMEYLEGPTLAEVLRRRGKLTIDEALDIAAQLLDALHYAGEQGIVHRDIKPSNMFLLADGRVKIADFGIAKLEREGTLRARREIIGTPSYMSPEQIRGRQVDRRTDIFSTGVVLYEMITGRRPFAGDSLEEIAYNMEYKEPQYDADIPPEICQIINKALRNDPAARYQTAGEMLEDIKAVQARRSYVSDDLPEAGPALARGPATQTVDELRELAARVERLQRRLYWAAAAAFVLAGAIVGVVLLAL